MLCSQIYFEFGRASSAHTKSLSRKGRWNLTAWWRRSLSTAGTISLISFEHYMVWIPQWCFLQGRGLQGKRLGSLARRRRAARSLLPPANGRVMGPLHSTLALQMGNKQLSSYSPLQWAWPGEQGHRWKGLSEIHVEQPCWWTSLWNHLSSAGCSGKLCRQRVREAVAGFKNWGQKNVKAEVWTPLTSCQSGEVETLHLPTHSPELDSGVNVSACNTDGAPDHKHTEPAESSLTHINRRRNSFLLI